MVKHGYTSSLLTSTIQNVRMSMVRGEITAKKLCQETFSRVDKTSNLNAFVTLCQDEAMISASRIDGNSDAGIPNKDKKIASSKSLNGIPISVKDNFCIDQVLTTCGSKMLHNFRSPYTATAVSKLKEAGAIIVGKTNMDEFAMGSSCTTSYYGPCASAWKSDIANLHGKHTNWDPAHWYMAGGSSTGSAVSVSSFTSFASLGTDTGGSARQPASLAGIVGFKPTYGLISRHGLVPLAHALDVVSILARNIDDTQLIFETVIGEDDSDLTTVNHHKEMKPSRRISPDEPMTIRIGIPENFISDTTISEHVVNKFESISRRLSTGGPEGQVKFEVLKLELPNSIHATECYTILSCAEIASNMSCYDGVKYGLAVDQIQPESGFDRDLYFRTNRDQGFGDEVKKRILLGNFFLLSGNRQKYLSQALKVRKLIVDEFQKAFLHNQLDMILMPSTPTTSISNEQWLKKLDDNKLFREDYFLIPSNLANLPSISVPCGLSADGLPVGLQLIANRFEDRKLLELSRFFTSYLTEPVDLASNVLTI